MRSSGLHKSLYSPAWRSLTARSRANPARSVWTRASTDRSSTTIDSRGSRRPAGCYALCVPDVRAQLTARNGEHLLISKAQPPRDRPRPRAGCRSHVPCRTANRSPLSQVVRRSDAPRPADKALRLAPQVTSVIGNRTEDGDRSGKERWIGKRRTRPYCLQNAGAIRRIQAPLGISGSARINQRGRFESTVTPRQQGTSAEIQHREALLYSRHLIHFLR